jgi:transcriptional regulator with AAA-type ATPase domain
MATTTTITEPVESASIHDATQGGDSSPQPQLIVALHCENPLASPTRHLLTDCDRVEIGRRPARAADRRIEAGISFLRLGLDDSCVSRKHVELERTAQNHWVAVDCGSRNGTTVNGLKIKRAILRDRSLLGVGNTLLYFRDAAVPAYPRLADIEGEPELAGAHSVRTFVGELAEQLAAVERVARSTLPVLVLGESGTGKELIARELHAQSGRSGPFLAVNCGAIPNSLIETTLFGLRRGTFTGATEDRTGVLRSARGGTVFLDEIGDLAPESQAALLRALQEHEVVPVGETRPVKIDARFVAATHRPLDEMIEKGAFRADLYSRLTGLTIRLPRLAERREDLGLLINALLRRRAFSAEVVTATPRFTPGAAQALFAHSWPLNVRELEWALGSALLLAGESPIAVSHLPASVRGNADSTDAMQEAALNPKDLELREALRALLVAHAGNVSAVAREMGKGRMQIHRWLQRFQIDLREFRS